MSVDRALVELRRRLEVKRAEADRLEQAVAVLEGLVGEEKPQRAPRKAIARKADAPPQRVKKPAGPSCRQCGKAGHNKRTCPELSDDEEGEPVVKPVGKPFFSGPPIIGAPGVRRATAEEVSIARELTRRTPPIPPLHRAGDDLWRDTGKDGVCDIAAYGPCSGEVCARRCGKDASCKHVDRICEGHGGHDRTAKAARIHVVQHNKRLDA